MHKKNIALISFGFAVVITALFFIFPEASRNAFVRFLYAPAILLTISMSDSIHSPSAHSFWFNLAFVTLTYWFIFWILIAFLSELFMIRRSFHCLSDEDGHILYKKAGIKNLLTLFSSDPLASTEALEDKEVARAVHRSGSDVKVEIKKQLEQLGKALKEVEGRRRQNFLLQDIDVLNLDEPDELLARHAIMQVGDERSVKALLRRMESTLKGKLGSRKAAKEFVEKLKEEARNLEATPIDLSSK